MKRVGFFQLYDLRPNCHILASAPSNSAADHLAEILLRTIPATQILRFYAASRDEAQIPSALLPISNFMREVNSTEIICSYRYLHPHVSCKF